MKTSNLPWHLRRIPNKVLFKQSEDWTKVYFDTKLVAEGHSLSFKDCLDVFCITHVTENEQEFVHDE